MYKRQIDKIFADLVVETPDWQAGTTFLTLIACLTLLNSKELTLFSEKSGWDNSNFDNVAKAIIENKEIL